MSLDNDYPPLPSERQAPPSEEFAAYCAAEFERRINSGSEFDEAAYREAQEMAMKKLVNFEEEGLA
jgi:hypothetical protein